MNLNPFFLPVENETKLFNIQGNSCYDENTDNIVMYIDGTKYFVFTLPPDINPGILYDSLIIGSHKTPNNVNPKKGIIDCSTGGINDYSGVASTHNSVIILGGSNTCSNQVINSILLGKDTTFTSTNSLIINNQFSIINNIVNSVLAVEQSNITNTDFTLCGGYFQNILDVDSSLIIGFQNTFSNSFSSSILGRNSTLTNGNITTLIGDNINFVGDIPQVNINNTLIGANIDMSFSSTYTDNILIGTNIKSTSSNNSIFIGAGSANASSVFYGGSPNTISAPSGFDNDSLALYGENLIMGADQSMFITGGIANNSKFLTMSGGTYNVQIDDYNIFVNNTSLINITSVVLPAISSLQVGQTWRITNASSNIPPFLHIISLETIDPGENLYTNQFTDFVNYYAKTTIIVVFDGYIFQVIT